MKERGDALHHLVDGLAAREHEAELAGAIDDEHERGVVHQVRGRASGRAPAGDDAVRIASLGERARIARQGDERGSNARA